jgi:hypothetical protein
MAVGATRRSGRFRAKGRRTLGSCFTRLSLVPPIAPLPSGLGLPHNRTPLAWPFHLRRQSVEPPGESANLHSCAGRGLRTLGRALTSDGPDGWRDAPSLEPADRSCCCSIRWKAGQVGLQISERDECAPSRLTSGYVLPLKSLVKGRARHARQPHGVGYGYSNG